MAPGGHAPSSQHCVISDALALIQAESNEVLHDGGESPRRSALLASPGAIRRRSNAFVAGESRVPNLRRKTKSKREQGRFLQETVGYLGWLFSWLFVRSSRTSEASRSITTASLSSIKPQSERGQVFFIWCRMELSGGKVVWAHRRAWSLCTKSRVPVFWTPKNAIVVFGGPRSRCAVESSSPEFHIRRGCLGC